MGQAYAYDVEATGDPAPGYALTAAPTGMTIDAVTGVIDWTPDTAGDYAVTVEASNSQGSDSQSFSVNVIAAGSAPVITSAPVTQGTVGQAYAYDVEATGDPAPGYALTAAPTGMTIDAVTGVIDWTPDTAGDYAVTVEASNSQGSDSQSFSVNVIAAGSAPVITSAPVTQGTVGQAYAYDVEATGDPAPGYALTAAPTGMTIDAVTGVIDWTPDTAGDYAVTVEASNSQGSDSQSFSVSVADVLACVADPLAHWRLDETSGTVFADSAGANNATCSGSGCPAFTTGIVNGALSFDGTDDGLNAADDNSLDWSNADSFSIELWVNTAQNCSGNKVFIGKYRGSGGNGDWWVGCSSTNTAAFYLRDSTGASLSVQSGSTINDGQWRHLVAVRDAVSNENRLYVDGALAASEIKAYSGSFANSRPINIGYYINNYRLNGVLDEVAIYARPLSSNEIQQHYANGLSGSDFCGVQAQSASAMPSTVETLEVQPDDASKTDGEGQSNSLPSHQLFLPALSRQ